jgi:hypothetical protein
MGITPSKRPVVLFCQKKMVVINIFREKLFQVITVVPYMHVKTKVFPMGQAQPV